MSKKDKTDEKKETKSGKSRRDFLRNSALGAVGVLAGLHLSRADRVLARVASRHAGDFFSRVRDVIPNDVDAAAFTDVFNQVNRLVESNPTYKENIGHIFNSIIQNGGTFSFTNPLTNLGLHTDTSNLLTAGYLGALSSLREGAPNRDLITRFLSDPSYIDQFIESDFVNSLYKGANAEVASNPRYARNSVSAASQLERNIQANGGGQPCTVPTYQDGQYVGETPCWVVVVVVVIIIVVIAVAVC